MTNVLRRGGMAWVVLASACASNPTTTTATEPGSTSDATPIDPPPTFDIHGHRGARGLRPEHSLPGFELALDLGVDVLEFDTQLSADGVPVLWHDAEFRPGNCRHPYPDHIHRRIEQLTTTEIGAFVCELNPAPQQFPEQRALSGELARDYSVLTLTELLEFVDLYATDPSKSGAQRSNAATARLNIEIKNQGRAGGERTRQLADTVVEHVQRAGLADRVTIQSFDLGVVTELAAEPDRELTVAALTSDITDLDLIAVTGADIWSPQHEILDAELVDEAASHGLKVVPWTVNTPFRMCTLRRMGVHGLITDYPDRVPSAAECTSIIQPEPTAIEARVPEDSTRAHPSRRDLYDAGS